MASPITIAQPAKLELNRAGRVLPALFPANPADEFVEAELGWVEDNSAGGCPAVGQDRFGEFVEAQAGAPDLLRLCPNIVRAQLIGTPDQALSQRIDCRKRRSQLMGQESDTVQRMSWTPRYRSIVRTARVPGSWPGRTSGGCGHGRGICITL
jgi:hypothetical protein